MGYSAKVLADSISAGGVRLITFEVTLPRIVLAELNTHRDLSRNSASSRAIPVEKQIQRVLDDPFVPIHWGKNQKGMQAEQELQGWRRTLARNIWLGTRHLAVWAAKGMLWTGVHKQITNRLLEPWMWQTVIISATQRRNFYGLRRHKDAQPEIKRAADLMWEAQQTSTLAFVPHGSWHMPMWSEDLASLPQQEQILACVGRCARVSYLTHDGRRDPQADIQLAQRLAEAGHMSPFEHVATPALDPTSRNANFVGWVQARKGIANEDDYSRR